ncbi:helix-turn-helix transcriptional regulator [Nocardia cyriacigeorgica]|uniref:Helix-turn-helix transcriptional regulator n=1 Tax=Nocardia cyriacigeorgica TaxID=135487 RepID=A0ABX0CI41_9NOCA|nr:helix-turn-helix transcriptional regulator [Nocardia cyriacigeorgica]NEW38023.1 helix-turn-helix transcriptional regulator [Nocardia cyriacigeorgica]NEW56224.1 helix-turn-helix transcriptional regulator [Nocardia cyriacigeorgica]
MLSATTLATRPEFTVTTVTCHSDHTHFSAPEVRDDHRLVLVRRGRFRRQANSELVDLDRTVGYIGAPSEEEGFAHPAGGDVCTAVTIDPGFLEGALSPQAVYVDARIELAHRRMLTAAAGGDIDYAVTEELVRLVALAAGRPIPPPRPADRVLVTAAREAIIDGTPESAGLRSLAVLLKVSPYRLSRVFSQHMGVSLTRYRNRIRVGHALDYITDGETSLADLAACLGFADQAHLTRTVREHLGHTPTALHRLLTPQPRR